MALDGISVQALDQSAWPECAKYWFSGRRMFGSQRLVPFCQAISKSFESRHSLRSKWPPELTLSGPATMSSQPATSRSALERPCAPEGIEHVVDRLSRLAAGPFPPVSIKSYIYTCSHLRLAGAPFQVYAVFCRSLPKLLLFWCLYLRMLRG